MSIDKITYPGQLIKAELLERGLKQKALAEALCIKTSHLSELLNGKRTLTPNVAIAIEEILDISANTLLSIQTEYSLSKKASYADKDIVSAESQLMEFDEIVDIKSLLKKSGFGRKSFVEKLEWIKTKYQLDNPQQLKSEQESLLNGCFRKSEVTGLDTRKIATWVIKANAKAFENPVHATYNADSINHIAIELSKILHENKGNTILKVRELLRANGIGFEWVEHEKGASIDGYSFVSNGSPYIVVTLRYNRIDNLAFTIMHEIGHIANNHISDSISKINITIQDAEEIIVLNDEQVANNFAAETLIPHSEWQFAPRVPLNPFLIQKKYSEWAYRKGFNKWIVLGRVSHETGMYRFVSDQTRQISDSNFYCSIF